MAPPASLAIRPFGSAEDLDLDFGGTDRPTLATALLAHCAGGDADHWWAQPVGARIAALLRLLMFSTGRGQVELGARCVKDECGDAFGFELPLAELAAREPSGGSWQVTLADGRTCTLRAPVGSDLLRWAASRPATREQALRTMLGDLVLNGDPTPGDEVALADAIASFDPLVALTVDAACPSCGHAQAVAIDIEGLALAHFDSRQRALVHDVHVLATHYGWTEQQVLAVPPARRAAYLALLDGEAR